jgi:hypothetical protein
MSDIIRRRALMGTRNGEAHECMVEYTVPITTNTMDSYHGVFGSINVTNVNWPEGITKILAYTFKGSSIDDTCFNNIPNTVTEFHRHSFANCGGLSTITLPSSLLVAGDYSLEYCYNLTSITLPTVPCVFGQYSLAYTSKLVTINVSENVPYAFHQNALMSSKWLTNQPNGNVYLGKNYIQYKGTMPANTDLTLESGTLSIAGYAFSSKTRLKSITIPNTVQYIGPGAFSGCTGLTSIDIPESLNKDFYSVPTSQGYRTSSGSSSGESILTQATSSPFYSSACTGITTVNWNAIDGYGGNSPSASSCFLGGGTYLPNVTTINFGPNVEAIPKYLCNGLKKIISITIPNSVKYIDYYAFGNCTGLTSITIPATIEGLSNSGFIITGCTGITTLNYNAVSAHSFSGSNYTSSTNTYLSLWGTTSNLTTVNIGNQVQIIPGGFLGSGQTNITSINIPSSVTTISYGAFYQSKLTSIDLPASVTSIGGYAFYGCPSLTSITIRATTPPTLDAWYTTTFSTSSLNCKIYVPASAVNTYKTASRWSYYSSKIQAIPS